MSQKLKIAVIFGGQSSEHEISCISVQTIVKAINPDKYETTLIGITKEGKWLLTETLSRFRMVHGTRAGPKQCFPRMPVTGASLLKETVCIQDSRLMLYFLCFTACTVKTGTIQGLFEMAKIPYVGCGVLSSAVSMDKAYTKLLVDDLGIRQADYVLIRHTDLTDMEACAARVEAKLKYPVFVKRLRQGLRAVSAKQRIGAL